MKTDFIWNVLRVLVTIILLPIMLVAIGVYGTYIVLTDDGEHDQDFANPNSEQ